MTLTTRSGDRVDTRLPSGRVTRVLDQIAEWRDLPARLRFDNGPDFAKVVLEQLPLNAVPVANWAETNGVELEFIKPGMPMRNGIFERFNRTYRETVLDLYIFESLTEVRSQTEKWLEIYDHHRPHDSRGTYPHANISQNITWITPL